MSRRQHLLIIDPLEKLKPNLDTSLNLGYSLLARDEAVFFATHADLHWRHPSEGGPEGFCQPLLFENNDRLKPRAGEGKNVSLRSFATIHMRKEPPFNEDYITATIFLEDAAAQGVMVFNEPTALRRFNEKLTIMELGDSVRNALVSCKSEELAAFIKDHANGDAILKPLGLYGGRGVERIKLADYTNEKSLLESLYRATSNDTAYRIMQPFDESIFQGEVRAFVIDAKPLAWCLKVPPAGNFLANTSSGATLEPYQPTPEEEKRVCEASEFLLGRGLRILGYDLIGGYISEVNVTSPRLLAGKGDDFDYYGALADWLIGPGLTDPIDTII